MVLPEHGGFRFFLKGAHLELDGGLVLFLLFCCVGVRFLFVFRWVVPYLKGVVWFGGKVVWISSAHLFLLHSFFFFVASSTNTLLISLRLLNCYWFFG